MNRSQDRYMEEFSVEELISKFNFYVPEIQREYVWGKNNKEILEKTLKIFRKNELKTSVFLIFLYIF